MVAASSWIDYTGTALLGGWVVRQLSTEWVDSSLVAEEEAGVVSVKATTLGMASAYTSDNMTFTAFEVEVWRNKRIS